MGDTCYPLSLLLSPSLPLPPSLSPSSSLPTPPHCHSVVCRKESDYVQRLGVTVELMNKNIFRELIFAESFMSSNLPLIIAQLRYGEREGGSVELGREGGSLGRGGSVELGREEVWSLGGREGQWNSCCVLFLCLYSRLASLASDPYHRNTADALSQRSVSPSLTL